MFAIALSWAAACGPGGAQPAAADDDALVFVVPRAPEAIDVLFVVDDSGSMAPAQHRLAAGIGAFVSVMQTEGRSLAWRIGITTTDNGHPLCTDTIPEGGKLQLVSCRDRAEAFYPQPAAGVPPPPEGLFELGCGSVCPEAIAGLEPLPTATEKDPTPRPRPWVAWAGGAGNLPPGVGLAEALACFLPQGIRGCMFESPLEAMWKAIRLSDEPGAPNEGFVRDDAILAVVVVSDEADCSLQPEQASAFDPEGGRVFWSDPEDPSPTSAVCWNAGVTCTGGPGVYDACDPANKGVDGRVGVADEDAVLLPVSRYLDLLAEQTRARMDRGIADGVVVFGIVGVSVGYAGPADLVYRDADDPEFQDAFGIGPGCSAVEGPVAVPPVRVRDVAGAVARGGEVNLHSVCDDTYEPALAAVARSIVERVPVVCVPDRVADVEPGTPDVLDPSCTMERVREEGGEATRAPVPPCRWTCGGSPCTSDEAARADGWDFPSDDDDLCYRILVDPGGRTPTSLDDMTVRAGTAVCAAEGSNLEVRVHRRPQAATVPGERVEVRCTAGTTPDADGLAP